MSIRLRLACALVLAALLPMGVAVGVAMLRAQSLAEEEAQRRLEDLRRVARLVGDRWDREAAARLGRAADDLIHDPLSLSALTRAPGDASAGPLATALARRHGLDFLDIVGAGGEILSPFAAARSAGDPVPGEIPEGRARATRIVFSPPRRGESLALLHRRSLPLANREAALVGGLLLDGAFVSEIASLGGFPARLLDAEDGERASAGGEEPAGPLLRETLPLFGGGCRVALAAPGPDTRRVRREMLGTFAGIAPFALASALAVGWILAEGFSRPIRALAARSERIASGEAGPLTLPPTRDELRMLTDSFDRMLASLEDSERQRIAAERIAAWQEIARRIAHEIKNPLSPIRLAVENLRRTRERSPGTFDRAFEEETAAILEAVDGLRRLVDEFSEFARLPAPRRVPADPAPLLEQALALFAPALKELGVRVETAIDRGLGPAPLDPEQIGRVLKNVLANAIEALRPVRDRSLHLALRKVPGPRGPLAEIVLRDTGVGFEAEALRRVFEPYFTTRAAGGGTGLGMAIAYRIVAEHEGVITASGTPGGGATITIRLPLERPAEAA